MVKRLSFKTADMWTGAHGHHEVCHKIKDKNNTARSAVIAAINAKLAYSSVLHSLALHLVDKTVL